LVLAAHVFSNVERLEIGRSVPLSDEMRNVRREGCITVVAWMDIRKLEEGNTTVLHLRSDFKFPWEDHYGCKE